MPKPNTVPVSQGTESWDTIINDNFKVLGRTGDPVPVPEFASEGALPAASAFTRCIAIVNNAQGWTIYLSNGSSWVPMARRALAVPDSIAADLASLVSDFNTLLSALRASGVIEP